MLVKRALDDIRVSITCSLQFLKGASMDFELTEEQKTRKMNARNFLDREIAPMADERDRQGPLTRDEIVAFNKKLMHLGYYNGRLPEAYGGANLDHTTTAILIGELFRVWAGLGATMQVQSMCPEDLLMAHEDVRERLLPRLAKGELISGAAITEPNAGSDTAAISTKAELHGDEYVINGTKTWITNGPVADIVTVTCVTDKSKGRKGISQIIVEKDVSPWESSMLHKIGWRASATAEVAFVDCRVPKENLLVIPAEGYRATLQNLAAGRASMALQAGGIMQAAIEASIKYAKERIQFGRPIGNFQLIQEMIADMIADTDATHLLGYRALHMIDNGMKARIESSMAKAYGCEACVRVTARAAEIHGAMGVSELYPVERYVRDGRMMTIPDGATQIQKLVIGREVLGMSAFH